MHKFKIFSVFFEFPSCIMASKMLKLSTEFITTSILGHIHALFVQLDPVENGDPKCVSKFQRFKSNQTQQNANTYQTKTKNKFNGHFVFISIFTITAFLLGTLGIEYEARGEIREWEAFTTSPYLFTHQMIPPELWIVADMVTHLATCTTSVTFLFYSLFSVEDAQYKMYYNGHRLITTQTGRTVQLQRKVSYQIVQFHRQYVSQLFLLFILLVTGTLGYFCTNVVLNSHYRLSIFSAIYWLYNQLLYAVNAYLTKSLYFFLILPNSKIL